MELDIEQKPPGQRDDKDRTKVGKGENISEEENTQKILQQMYSIYHRYDMI